MDDVKVIYADGDSWTAGDIVDPEIFGDRLDHVMHPDNNDYRLPKVWPHKLGKIAGKKVVNNSYAGSSNDAIVRRVVDQVPNLLNVYKPEEILVVVGWSSPERKDFFYSYENERSWETLYPAELQHWDHPDEERKEFYKIYVNKFWNKEEYISRFIHHVIYLDSYLSKLGVKYVFFNAFYEDKATIYDKNSGHKLLSSPSLNEFIMEYYSRIKDNNSYLKFNTSETIFKQFNTIYKDLFLKTSFIQYLKDNFKNYSEQELIDYHPTELGHQLWAEKLGEELFGVKNDYRTLYHVKDDFNSAQLDTATEEVLKLYAHIPEINEKDERGFNICRPLFSHSDIPMLTDSVNIKPEEIGEKNFIYCTTLHHHNFLAAEHLNLLPDYVLKGIKNKKCRLILDNTLEGDILDRFIINIHKSLSHLNLDPKQIYYITNNLIAEEDYDRVLDQNNIQSEKINILSFPWNIHDVKRLQNFHHLPKEVNIQKEIEFKKRNINDIAHFLKVNRTGRPERNLFMLFINKYNLYKNFKISFPSYPEQYNLFNFFPELTDPVNIQSLKAKVPFDIDDTDRRNHGEPGRGDGRFDADLPFDPIHYRTSFVSVVMCAFPFVENACHLHSSTFNPIYCGHPVIQFGPYQHLKKLKELGFKTFDKWWDESYDNIEFGWDRLKAIFDIVLELNSKSKEEMMTMYEEMQDTLQHNSDLIKNFDGNRKLRDFVNGKI